MADYTLLNLKEDVEDAAAKHGRGPDLESHFARGPLGMKEGGLSQLRLAPGFRMPFGHKHERQEEVYVVISGTLRVKVEEEVLELGPWDALRVGPGTMTSMEGGPEGAELLAFGAPNTANGDAEMVPGWWSDQP